MNLKQAYDEIEKIALESGAYPGLAAQMKSTREKHERKVRIEAEYGIVVPLDSCVRDDYFRIDGERYVSLYDGINRKVSWSDDDRQPAGEMLYVFAYSTGGYFFSDDYPKDLFEEFFQELKSYGPKYSDSVNHCLFFPIESSAKIANDYAGIIKKYRDRNATEYRLREAKRLEAQAAKLRGDTE